jgi:alkylation response protein AidB-like acyl-CoA dehydrogenase
MRLPVLQRPRVDEVSDVDPWAFPTWGDPAVAAQASDAAGDIAAALRLARVLSPRGADTGRRTWPLLSTLATLGSVDLSTARAVEPHLDAQAILAQAELGPETAPPEAAWGVYAADPPGTDLRAELRDGSWALTGTKPWCSLPEQVSHALVTARAGSAPQLFAVSLRDDTVRTEVAAWRPNGLRQVSTGSVHFTGTVAQPVGPPGWYLERPGFAWGGIAVAAVWFGGAAALAGALWRAAAHREPDQIALMHLGACDAELFGALTALRHAATVIDSGALSGDQAGLLAARVRAVVAATAEHVLTTVGHALGPGPLSFDDAHLTRVADLTLYLRQHHAERDLARLGTVARTAHHGPDDPGGADREARRR